MHKKEKFVDNQFTWPICKKLLFLILEDKVSDIFVCELIWERLFYAKQTYLNKWKSTALTPFYWAEKFEEAPQIISERPASIHLTRSIPKSHKQGLKEVLNFRGYKINELFPRRTRRATAVNWLIYWAIESKSIIDETNYLPKLSSPPSNPVKGHHGDPDIK